MPGSVSTGNLLAGAGRRLARRTADVIKAPVRAGRRFSRRVVHSPFPLSVSLRWLAQGEAEDYWAQARLLSRCCRAGADGECYYRIGGRRFYYHPHFRVQERELREGVELILREGFLHHEPAPPEVAARPGDVVLDLGGNIGTLALEYAQQVQPAGRVFSFEPIMHRPLARNIAVNGASRIVEVVPAAVADRPGRATFHVRGNCIDSRLAGAGEEAGSAPVAAAGDAPGGEIALDVPVTTIDAFVAERALEQVDVIKSDIEGAEELAMRGAGRTVERFHPRWVISSYHTDPEGDKQHPKLVRRLKAWGYRVIEIEARRIYAYFSSVIAMACEPLLAVV